MNIQLLSEKLGFTVSDMLAKVTYINATHKLGITDVNDMTRTQYDIIRATFDTNYLVKLLNGDKRGGKYNYQNTPGYIDMEEWVSSQNLNNFSTKQVMQSLPVHVTGQGMPAVAAAMKYSGYESRVMMLDNGKQGRRWFKDELWDQVSFL